MDRFKDWYGGSVCSECVYYGKSERCWKMRCRHEDNTRDSVYGVVYMKHPDELNWNQRCTKFKKKKENKDAITE